MLPVPTLAELSLFTGRPLTVFSGFAAQALEQATLLFSVVTRLTDYPASPDGEKLARYAILEMADKLILEQPHAATLASPFQSESTGAYSYSKSATAVRARTGQTTGLFWWDLALDELRVAGSSDVGSGSIQVRNDGLARDEDQVLFLVGPPDEDSAPAYIRIS